MIANKPLINPLYAAQMNRVGRYCIWPPCQPQQFDFGRSGQGALMIGDTNEAIDKILQVHELFGLTHFFAHVDCGGPSDQSLMKSI